MGLIVIPVLLSYLVFATLFPIYLARRAKKQGGKGWIWGWGMFLLLWGLAFWEWPFNTMTHNYYCENEAGFVINKTLDEWKQENPGVVETLVASKEVSSTNIGDTTKFVLNQRLTMEHTNTNYWFDVVKIEEKIVDIQTGNILAEYIDFNAKRYGGGNLVFAFWDGKWSCEPDGEKVNREGFSNFLYSIKHNKEYNNGLK